MTELICIVCPKGCRLHVDEGNNYTVTGNGCSKGYDYGRKELINPTRVLTSTVCVEGGLHRRCPVKTEGAIPKALLFEAMYLLDDVRLNAPVAMGQIIIENICDTGINVIATRSLSSEK